jgi:hypothetical protein
MFISCGPKLSGKTIGNVTSGVYEVLLRNGKTPAYHRDVTEHKVLKEI